MTQMAADAQSSGLFDFSPELRPASAASTQGYGGLQLPSLKDSSCSRASYAVNSMPDLPMMQDEAGGEMSVPKPDEDRRRSKSASRCHRFNHRVMTESDAELSDMWKFVKRPSLSISGQSQQHHLRSSRSGSPRSEQCQQSTVLKRLSLARQQREALLMDVSNSEEAVRAAQEVLAAKQAKLAATDREIESLREEANARKHFSYEVASDDELHDAAAASELVISSPKDGERLSEWSNLTSRQFWPAAVSTMPDLPNFEEEIANGDEIDDDGTSSMPELSTPELDEDEGGLRVCVGKFSRNLHTTVASEGPGSSFSTQASWAPVLPPLPASRTATEDEMPNMMGELVSDTPWTAPQQNQNILMEFALRGRPALPQGRRPFIRRLRGARPVGA